MMIFKTPQINDQERIYYKVMGDIVEATVFKLITKVEGDQEIIEEEFHSTSYFDLSNIKQGKLYLPHHPIVNAKKEQGTLKVELLNYINSNATEIDLYPEWEEVVENSFKIPDNAKLIQLEELPPPIADKGTHGGLREIELRMAQLEQYVKESQEATEALLASTLEAMRKMVEG